MTMPTSKPAGAGRAGAAELLWIPLGAGANVVRLSGRAFERVCAFRERRAPQDIYHSALRVALDDDTYVIEMTPVPRDRRHERGAVAEGPVGARWAGALRVFRYEVRCWRNGVIPDVAAAVSPPTTVLHDEVTAARLLDLVRVLPTPVWGRDELRAGEMWNSNSVTAWLLAMAGADVARIRPPIGGRAPGWNAGLVVAGRTPALPADDSRRLAGTFGRPRHVAAAAS
jgi:hypothetical protein